MPRHDYDDDDDRLLLALQNIEPCGNCGADGAKLPCMSGCGEVFYCSRECMMHHASAHRLRCRNLRCSKFNDSDSESYSSEDQELTDADEYETDSSENEKEEEEVKVAPKPGKKKKGGRKSIKKIQSKGGDIGNDKKRIVSVDPEAEKRIEEKILRRLKKQEESRIATAIEQRMKEEKANWRDEEMNRIIIEMRERIQREMKNATTLVAMAKKNGVSLESLVSSDMVQNGSKEEPNRNLQRRSDDSLNNMKDVVIQSNMPDRSPSTMSGSKAPIWNNSCAAFEALRVVVWKHSFLPHIKFCLDPETGIWNMIKHLEADRSFSHILVGDCLLFINGRPIDSTVQTEEDLDDVFAAFASPLVLKFKAKDPHNGKVHDYSVTWSNGPLGVTLKDDCTSDKVPIVNRLTKKAGSVAAKQNIAIGDILVAINNIDTIQLGCSLSMSILKKVQLPATLRFRGVGGSVSNSNGQADDTKMHRHASDEMEIRNSATPRLSHYTIKWNHGPLGLTIIPGLTQHDLPVIKKVTGTGTSSGIELAQVGDFLVSMNERLTSTMPFEDIVAYLKSSPKPMILKFRVATEEDSIRPSSEILAQNLRHMVVTTSPAKKSREHSNGKHSASSRQESLAASSFSQSSMSSSLEKNQEIYNVVWGSGSLGLTIDAIPNSSGAYIKRIASQGAAAHLSNNCIGDELLRINDLQVGTLQFSEIVTQLKVVPRPVTLYFLHRGRGPLSASYVATSSSSHGTFLEGRHSDASSGVQNSHQSSRYYTVLWQEGTTLGLSLRGADSGSDYPYITRITGTGCAAHLPSSVIGDALISVNGRSVHHQDKTFEEVMSMMKNMPKPLTLKFESRAGSLARSSSSSNVRSKQHSPPEISNRQALAPDSQDWRSRTTNLSSSGASRSLPDSNEYLNRSFAGSETSMNSMQEEKFNNIQGPFLAQNKLSTNRRQRMLKGLKK